MADVSGLTRLPGGVLAPLDASSRGVGEVMAAAIPVVAVCGRNLLETESLRSAGIIAAYALTDLEPDVQKCIAEAAPLLVRLGEQIATDHLSRRTKVSRADSGEGDSSVGRPIQDRVRR
jgi:glycerate kinase